MIEKLYTVEEVADLASVTGRTIRNYLKSGRLVGRKIGGQWRFPESEVQRLLNGGMGEVSQANQTAENPPLSSTVQSPVTSSALDDFPQNINAQAFQTSQNNNFGEPLPIYSPPSYEASHSASLQNAPTPNNAALHASNFVADNMQAPHMQENAELLASQMPSPDGYQNPSYYNEPPTAHSPSIPPAKPIQPFGENSNTAPRLNSQNFFGKAASSADFSQNQMPSFAAKEVHQPSLPTIEHSSLNNQKPYNPAGKPLEPQANSSLQPEHINQPSPFFNQPSPAYAPVAPQQASANPIYERPAANNNPPANLIQNNSWENPDLIRPEYAAMPPQEVSSLQNEHYKQAPPPIYTPERLHIDKPLPAQELQPQLQKEALVNEKPPLASPPLSDVAKRVTRFISQVHDCSNGPQVCCVFDLHQSLSTAKTTSEQINKIATQESESGTLCQSFVEFDERYYVARYTVFGTSSFLFRCVKLLG